MFIDFPRIKKIIGLILIAFRQYRGRFIILTILGFLSGVSAALGISAVIPLFEIATDQNMDDPSFVTQTIQFIFSHLHIPLTPVYLILFIAFLFIIKAIIQFSSRYMSSITVSHFEEDMRHSLFSKMMNSDWSYLSNQKIGLLESIVLVDVERSATILNYISSLILISTGFVMYAIVAFSISPSITLLTILICLFLFLIFKPIFYKTKKYFQINAGLYKKISHHISEHLSGAKMVKITSSEKPVIKYADKYFKGLRQAKISASFYRQSTLNTIEPLSFILIAILFIFSYEDPGFSITSFAVVMYLVQKMFNFIQQMQSQAHSVYEFIPFLKSILNYRKQAMEHDEEDNGTKPFVFNYKLSFDNVSFNYEDRTTLSHMSFDVEKGTTVGILGPSGVGKTTVVDLILRLLKQDSGDITIDGTSISNIDLRAWRDKIGYVPQDVFLLNDTIENNIRFYNPNITHQKIIDASKMANINDTIEVLPDKWDTIVGERGVKLSGGQRQRITLARALARKPELLILDEATSAIDSQSEQLIQQAIDNLHGNVTIIIIAHRISTIENADKLIVLKDGKVEKEGRPDAIL